ncbi:unnamed protein product [Peronospora belbahrii]|uniref:Uncharacterized protein n=1 Tax=Peronospora belbahrii TaxID=622444 RepID=A0AAU9KJR4_9STRA|nr:unnamed protein product [Peronospora belbahrii]
MVSTTSSVVFYPFAATFPPLYTTALATGEGLSGSLAALLGIIQDPGDTRRFSVSVFYLLCAAITCGSLVAFAFLHVHPWAQAVQMLQSTDNDQETDKQQAEENTLLTWSCSCGNCSGHINTTTMSIVIPTSSPSSSIMSRTAVLQQVWPLLACQWVLAAFSFGWLPSTMPYVYKKFAPMDDDAQAATARFQTSASIAALILSPLASAATTWVRLYYVRSMTLALVLLASLLLSFSLVSKPVLSDHRHGYLLPLLVHTFYLIGCAYTQTMLYLTLKRTAEMKHSTAFARQVYQWNGLATQLGAMSGTAITFPLVFWCENLFTA